MAYDVRTDPYFSDDTHHDAPRRIARRMLLLFDQESKWTKKAFARDASGHRVDPGSTAVVCRCLQTCMVKACDIEELTFSDLDRTWKVFDHACGGIMSFNDNSDTTFADIVSLIRRIADEQHH